MKRTGRGRFVTKARIAINALIMDKRKAGIGNYAFHLLQAMNRLSHGLEADVYIQRQMQEYFPSEGTMRFLPCPDFKGSRDRILYEQFRLPREYLRQNYTIVHFLDYMSPLTPMKAKKVVTIHDLSYFVYPEFFTTGSRLMKQFLTGPSVRSAARVICVSNNTKNDVQRLYHVPDKLKVTHLGVDPDCSVWDAAGEQEILRKYGIRGSYIMHTGTLEPRKNTAALVRAFCAAVRKGDLPQSLVLCGKPGWKYEGIFQEIEHSGLKDRILITGYVPDEELPVLFHHADAFVYPSLYEGFGLPPLEAMVHGTPVICSFASSLPEVTGDAALTFPPRDEEKLAELIIRIIKEPGIREELRQKGFKQALKFTWEKTAEKTMDVYRELV
jgi:glycosyltransferase involved in cell wall biosynthesis